MRVEDGYLLTAIIIFVGQEADAVTYTSCVDAQSQGQSSGYTMVQPPGLSTAYELWCNQDDYGGGEE